jgi:lactoylglutathione lyase
MQFKYHHVSRSTQRLDAMLTFYAALGCELQKRVNDESQGIDRAVLSLPGTTACLQFIQRREGAVSPPGLDWPDHLAFHTADLASSLQTLLQAGATLAREPYRTPSGSLVCFVKDPDGNQIELVEKRELA